MEIREAKQQRKTSLEKAFFMTKEMYIEFEKRRKKEFPRVKALKKLVYNEETDEVTGSNDFIVCYTNTLLPEGFRTASQADLERILKESTLPLKGHMVFTSLVLRSNSWPNQYLANNLYKQFKAKGINLKKGLPYVIPLFGLKLVKDEKSPEGLSFRLTDRLINEKLYFIARILNEPTEQKFYSRHIDESTGLPIRVGKKGDRKLYTNNLKETGVPYFRYTLGLSDLYLGGENSDIGSEGDDLLLSGSACRTVIVSD